MGAEPGGIWNILNDSRGLEYLAPTLGQPRRVIGRTGVGFGFGTTVVGSEVSGLESGPAWNVEEFPSSYNGAPIQWDPERYDTAAMPFIVAIRQHFWSWRITRFAAATGLIEVDLALPSAMPDGFTMIGFDSGDEPPEALLDEFAALLRGMGRVMLDDPWTFRLLASDGVKSELYEGAFGGSAEAG